MVVENHRNFVGADTGTSLVLMHQGMDNSECSGRVDPVEQSPSTSSPTSRKSYAIHAVEGFFKWKI